MNDPVIRYEFTRPDGTTLVRELTMDEAPKVPPPVPHWLMNPHKKWDRPQDPILFTGAIKPGYEAKAEEWVASL